MSNSIRAALAAVAIAVCCAAPIHAQPKEPRGEVRTVRIASSMPRVGVPKKNTDALVRGIQLAISEDAGLLKGVRIELFDWNDGTADGQWSPELERENAMKATKDPSVLAYIGPYNSGAAKVSMPILNRAGMLMVSPTASWPGLTRPEWSEEEPNCYRPATKPNFVRIASSDDWHGYVAAQWAKTLGVRTAIIVDDGELYGAGIASQFAKGSNAFGIKILSRETLDTKNDSFAALAKKIKAGEPDLVYFGGATETKGGLLFRDLAQAGLASRFMVAEGCMDDVFVQQAGSKNLEGRCFATVGGVPLKEMKSANAFRVAYRKKHQEEPPEVAGYGYDAAKLVLAAIGKAKAKDREATLNAAFRGDQLEGCTGRWKLDIHGDPDRLLFSGYEFKRGKFQFAKQVP